ncbi:hypothetical protein HPB50_004088 [Hyalomma asiaticum]|uniref:Uncharacterized protein n=1 Tax=Hyalomma asiaticum TaxID=266040 RepID=A0ACB7TCM5_HYAAI|nr:hypothetical protein HPB50_004088 [Hyalomma asiaticum]
MLPEKLDYRTARRFSRQTGSGIGDRLRRTEQGMTGRGYAISCMVATRHTIRPNPMATQRDAKDMWRPRARNPCAKEASVRSGNRSREGGLPHDESVRWAERWWVQEADFNSRSKASGRGGGYAISCMVATSRKIRDHIHGNTTRADTYECLMQKTHGGARGGRGGDSSGRGGDRPLGCFKCKQEGHIAKDCNDEPLRRVGPDGKPMEAPYVPAFSPYLRGYSLLEYLYGH